ncbi:esterase family protein [Subtercola sp. PAMC28395]|uniref:alpha/beta hydrolase-fold protein n=1 Tax=Subtercola sp. PAMC28395 TaxID=2846775 RepID=UPI001C0C9212|nr:alpha/beta hydrolase-fold protein [Subtercola sp. PAMC28395]QWT24906.1 esterase family protein [Subtercola sp. PAMC28395]
MTDLILSINIVDGPAVVALVVLSLGLAGYLLARRPTPVWVLTALVGLLAGAAVALVTVFLTEKVFDLFGVGFSTTTITWIVLTFAGIGLAIVNLWRSRWWRKVVAGVAILIFALTGTVGVNSSIGLTKTVGALLGIGTEKPLVVPTGLPTTPHPTGTSSHTAAPSTVPLYQSWTPPADMPSVGTVGTIDIPNTNSGFVARKALAYLPPAALVQGAPALPVIIQLNGSPGSPGLDDPKSILDQMASANKGLAPIVINPDQLGDPSKDPLCLDATSDKVETYIMNDVVPYVRTHFNVLQDPKSWAFVGFSNGGECAAYFGAKYPNVFGNVVDISGDQYQAIGDNGAAQKYFGGDAAAYKAAWPQNILASGAHAYPDTLGVFTAGSDDQEINAGVRTVFAAAKAAGWKASFTEIPNAGHDGPALDIGLQTGYNALYPRWGLAASTG